MSAGINASCKRLFWARRIISVLCAHAIMAVMHAVESPRFTVPTLLPEEIQYVVPDLQIAQTPDRVQLNGWMGSRIAGNEASRLVKVDTARLLEGYQHRPSRQIYDGEHVGKWLHAATLAWVYTGDPALRAKLDETVIALSKCQLVDGYLGTYLDSARWTQWDVWVHKYNLIGLLTYAQYTGSAQAMTICRRMGDMLCQQLGDGPGQRDINKIGRHIGMASTSVLEPMVLLYRMTGEQRYLDFCHYIVRAWELSAGAHLVSDLLASKGVNMVANKKAYEMLSCLNGALEMYRSTGDRRLLQICINAWQDIVDKRLYLTGAASYFEHFHDDFDLPNTGNVGETCVTVTWLQFNAQLLRLTGEARFADQLERVLLNQLLGAQKPDCSAWGYYVQMEGRKPYSSSQTSNCCLSSGPRGLALVPTFALTTDREGVVVNLYEQGSAQLTLPDGSGVAVNVETAYPFDSSVRLRLLPASSKEFSMRLRLPDWCQGAGVKLNGQATEWEKTPDGYAVLRRTWSAGDVLDLNLPLSSRVVVGEHSNAGKVAFLYGPLVLAADDEQLTRYGQRVETIVIPQTGGMLAATLDLGTAGSIPRTLHTRALGNMPGPGRQAGAAFDLPLVPFAEAGASGSRFRVWLPLADQVNANLLLLGTAVFSVTNQPTVRSEHDELFRPGGNHPGSINDDDLFSTADQAVDLPAVEAWYAVDLPAAANVRRIVFIQGESNNGGGWFDTSEGKPRIQVRKQRDGAWETVGKLGDYPATTAITSNGLVMARQKFECRLEKAVSVWAVRVLGLPSQGNRKNATYLSCSELQAFTD